MMIPFSLLSPLQPSCAALSMDQSLIRIFISISALCVCAPPDIWSRFAFIFRFPFANFRRCGALPLPHSRWAISSSLIHWKCSLKGSKVKSNHFSTLQVLNYFESENRLRAARAEAMECVEFVHKGALYFSSRPNCLWHITRLKIFRKRVPKQQCFICH